MQRIGRLLQASMFLNYMWQKMRVAGAPSRWGGKPRGRVIAETTIHIAETTKPAAYGPVLGVWSSSTEHEVQNTKTPSSVLSVSLCLFYPVRLYGWRAIMQSVQLKSLAQQHDCGVVLSNSWHVAILPLLWWHSDFPHGWCPDIYICTLKPHMQDVFFVSVNNWHKKKYFSDWWLSMAIFLPTANIM